MNILLIIKIFKKNNYIIIIPLFAGTITLSIIFFNE